MDAVVGAADREHMRRALDLAERGWGMVQPNPMVGALVVRGNEIVGSGWHERYGGDHAEVVALREAGDAARGATLYVTLEPCSHFGKTPPCTTAIQSAGIRRVVYAAEDPHASAHGGAERLRDSGLEVVGGVERDAARAQNAAFFHLVETGTPYVALKLALSLDARIAAAPGLRTQLTGEEAWAEVHRLRAGHEAILVGIETALADDPRLTPRGAVKPRRPPLRIVLDSRARLPLGSHLVRTARDVPVWVCCAPSAPPDRRAALEAAAVRVVELPRDATGAGLDLAALLGALNSDGRQSVLAEGGARVAASLLEGGLVRRLHLFLAPVLLGRGAVDAFAGSNGAGVRWRLSALERFGNDTLLVLDAESAPERLAEGTQSAP